MTSSSVVETAVPDGLLDPRSIAVVGASADLGKPGGRCVQALRSLGFAGEVYPVSSSQEQIAGYRTVPGVDALPDGVDLVIIAVRAAAVPGVLREAGRRGVRHAVVLSSGFRETGEEGARLEREIASVAQELEMSVLGPNCLGFVDVARRVAASFTTALDMTASGVVGDVALVSQSGAMGAAIFGMAQAERVGISSFVSTGNETVLGFTDVVDRLVRAAGTAPPALLGYVEGVDDGRAFIKAIRTARTAGTDVAILKVGTTEAGQRAAQSHTGAMSGSDKVWDAALRRAGARRAHSPSDLLDLAMAFGSAARPVGRRVAILSMSGGAGVLMADRAHTLGLETPVLGEATRRDLAALLPGFSALGNPIDFGGVYTDPTALVRLVRTVADDPGIDTVALFVGLSPGLVGAFEQGLAEVVREAGKPIVVSWFGAPREGLDRLRDVRIPTTSDPVRAMDMIHALVESTAVLPEDLRMSPVTPEVSVTVAALGADAGRTVLSEVASKRLIAAAGLRSPREVAVSSAQEAQLVGASFDRAIAVKVDAPGMVHKSDVGGVALDVEPEEAGAAFRRVVDAASQAGFVATGAVLAEMADVDRIELLVGTRWDEQFGAVIVVGSGGTRSEVDDDVCVDLAPVSPARAREMICSLRSAPLLDRFRGGPVFDVEAAAAAVARASVLAAGLGARLQELDVNPLAVFADGGGCLALDAVAIMQGATEEIT